MALDLDQTCTAAELAGSLNLTTRRVFQLADEGVLPRATRGRFALLACVKGYTAYLQELARGRPASNRELAIERLALTRAKRVLAELEAERWRGNYVLLGPMIRSAETAGRIERDRVLGIPDRYAEELAADCGGDPVRLRAGLTAATRQFCHEVSNEFFRLAAQLESERGGGGGDASTRNGAGAVDHPPVA